jgi:uncharacterized phage-associated protein
MPIPIMTAAKRLCEKSGNSLTDIELYRLLYIAQMTHLGEYNTPLVEEKFEAWEFGPVQPDLYHKINLNGESALKQALNNAEPVPAGSEKLILDQTYDNTKKYDGDWLNAVTRWENGAWSKCFDPQHPNATIPNDDIRQEYIDRMSVVH